MKIRKVKAIGWKSHIYALEWTHYKRKHRIGVYTPKWVEFLRPSDAWYRWKQIVFNFATYYDRREFRVLCFGYGYLDVGEGK